MSEPRIGSGSDFDYLPSEEAKRWARDGHDASKKNDFGKLAYEAYAEHTGWKSLATCQPLPGWQELPQPIRDAWNVAAGSIINLCLTWGAKIPDAPYGGMLS